MINRSVVCFFVDMILFFLPRSAQPNRSARRASRKGGALRRRRWCCRSKLFLEQRAHPAAAGVDHATAGEPGPLVVATQLLVLGPAVEPQVAPAGRRSRLFDPAQHGAPDAAPA